MKKNRSSHPVDECSLGTQAKIHLLNAPSDDEKDNGGGSAHGECVFLERVAVDLEESHRTFVSPVCQVEKGPIAVPLVVTTVGT